LERRSAAFNGEVARGEIKRSSLNEFLQVTRDAAAQLVANLNRAAEMIQSFKQVAADRVQAEQRTFDIGELTEQVLTSLRPSMHKRNLTMNVECSPNLEMRSYPGPFGQVVTNLFLNSITHGFAERHEGTIDIKVRPSGNDNVEVVFADDGCGMSASVRHQAFNPFFTTRHDQGCTGLGLHIVHNIVTNRLGGTLSLDSELGEGTKVRLILPRVAPVA
jgi:signal transduction histidine kinase